MTIPTPEDVEKLVERLKESEAAFRENTVYTADGDPVRLGVQADEMRDAAALISTLQSQLEAARAERDEAEAYTEQLDKSWFDIAEQRLAERVEWMARAQAAEALLAEVGEVLDGLVEMAPGIATDLLSAHRGRIGASEWMAEDDRDQRRDFKALSEKASALLSRLRSRGEGQ